MKQGRSRLPGKREPYLARLAELTNEGLSLKECAETLKVSQGLISRDRAILRQRWQEENQDHIEQERFHILEKLNRIEEEAWDAWDRSIGQATKTTKRVRQVNGEARQEISESIETMNGDPRYLAIINDTYRRRSAILGLDAPKEMTVDATTTTFNIKAKLDLGISDADRWIKELQSNGPIREAEVAMQERPVLPVGVRDETSGREPSVDTGPMPGGGGKSERNARSLGERALQIHDHNVRIDDTGHTEQPGTNGMHPVVQSTNGKSVPPSNQRGTGEQ